MKKTMMILVVVLGGLIPAAHAHRWYGLPEALAWLVPVVVLFATGRDFVRRLSQAVMVAGALVTLNSMLFFIKLRMSMGTPWLRLAVILSLAAMVPVLAAWVMQNPFFTRMSVRKKERESLTSLVKPDSSGAPGAIMGDENKQLVVLGVAGPASPWPAVAACTLTFLSLAMVQMKVPTPMLMAERFVPGAGWLEASLLAVYAGFATEAMLQSRQSSRVRRFIWGLFSFVFFAQLALGLAGFGHFLMSGTLHLPVPALIVAGPLFRGGEGLFMPILFGITVCLVGPAWCSHLCYIGAWDSWMSRAKKRPGALPGWVRPARMALAGLIFVSAWLMGRIGVPGMDAALLAAGFGLAGVVIMVLLSRKHGVMTHCTGYCPMGLVAGLLGKVSPWRLRIKEGCAGCATCALACRYDALRPEDLAARRPGVSCSLCGDCLESCPKGEMEFSFLGQSGPGIRAAFIVLAVSLHAVFLGVARL
ncbi:MAG: 4Fe-4S binding protein [Desulfovibrio sp.]|nr:4Fe-4S binding protein [Desulfovibrio sp.]MBI4960837.1 4Fe-4S binding protein [Desulfovibrio sp.]